ncbi:MAG: co-chaperone GroES [Kiritimatiellia bacterium]
MKLRPMNGRVVVKPSGSSEETKGGIVIPDTAQEKKKEGKVIAVAEDATEEVAVGDRVIYREFGGTEIKLDDKDLVLLTADDLVAKYEEKDKIPE